MNNSRVLEYVHGARHLFQIKEQPSVGIYACGKTFVSKRRTANVGMRAWGKAFVSKRRTAKYWNT